MPDYKLTTHAEQDLRDIARYTINQWGIAQAERYEALLSKRFQEIAQGIVALGTFSKRRPSYCLHIVSIIIFSTCNLKTVLIRLF